jgi:hypothetical protein
MEVARSDERLRGSTAPAVVTENTPEASLSREGAFGSIDSPGRLTRRAPRFDSSLFVAARSLTVAGQRRSLTGFPGRILMNTTRLERHVNRPPLAGAAPANGLILRCRRHGQG